MFTVCFWPNLFQFHKKHRVRKDVTKYVERDCMWSPNFKATANRTRRISANYLGYRLSACLLYHRKPTMRLPLWEGS